MGLKHQMCQRREWFLPLYRVEGLFPLRLRIEVAKVMYDDGQQGKGDPTSNISQVYSLSRKVPDSGDAVT
jgi:hypothetical protein